MEKLRPGAKIYFMGIAGTGMASVAGLMQEAGYKISGSDNEIYPPMSTMLDELGIEVKTPYSRENLNNCECDMVVVANVLSRGHKEMEAMMEKGIPYTSFPALLGDNFLEERISLVVSGTHGKTTTSSMLAFVLDFLNEQPGFLIGGIPHNFPRSFRVGQGKAFVLEGDEYDTAWFDKESKFLHYRPNHVLFNNLEFDHADIFDSLEKIDHMFEKLLKLVPKPEQIIANIDDEGVVRICEKLSIMDKVLKVSTEGAHPNADIVVTDLRVEVIDGVHWWYSNIKTKDFGVIKIKTTMSGKHNMSNIAQVIGCIASMKRQGNLIHEVQAENISVAFEKFKGVKRRLEHLASIKGVEIFEDFAHHPTAVGNVIESYKKAEPNRRLVVAFEPRNATARRNVFQEMFSEKLCLADQVLIGKCPVDLRIPESQRMDTKGIEKQIGAKAKTFEENEQLLDFLVQNSKSGDTVIFMSSGSFSGIQHMLAQRLNY